MKTAWKSIFRPLQTAKMPLFAYTSSILISSSLFPIAQLLLGVSQKNLVNAVEYRDPGRMGVVILASVSILFLTAFLDPVMQYVCNRAIHKFTFRLRENVLMHLVSLPISYFVKKHSGDVMTRVSSDLDAVASIYSWHLNRFFLAIFYGIGSLLVMAFLCWQLAVVIVILAVVETLIIAKCSLKINALSKPIGEKHSLLNSLFLELIKGARMIRILSLGEIFKKKFQAFNQEISDFSLERKKRTAMIGSATELFNALNLVFVLWAGILTYFLHMADLGSVMAFLVLQDGISYMFNNLGEFFAGIQQSIVSVSRLYELLDEQPEEERADRNCLSALGPIRCEGLDFGYENRSPLSICGFSCSIPENRITAVVGPSGCGKTTFLKLLLDFLPAQEGSIYIGEMRYADLSKERIRAQFAYVPQNIYLFQDTIEANIRCGNESATFEEVVSAAKAALAHDFIIGKPGKYQEPILEQGENLSGGQRQRIAIARAILKNAPILLLDEATNAVDVISEAAIHESVKHQVEAGKTVILVAHREAAQALADVVIRME